MSIDIFITRKIVSEYGQEIPQSQTINNESTTEPPPQNGQQPKPLRGLNAFYWYQIFALDSAVVEVQKMLSSHG